MPIPSIERKLNAQYYRHKNKKMYKDMNIINLKKKKEKKNVLTWRDKRIKNPETKHVTIASLCKHVYQHVYNHFCKHECN
jgi:hypothetical protein